MATLQTIVNLDSTGSTPEGSLIFDAKGDLFGVASGGGANGDGSVFEIVNSAAGYASTATVLASFDSADGLYPAGSLIADANGDLFGTAVKGGANNDGTVFEIVNGATGYDGTPSVLVSFDGTDGKGPSGSLLADAAGDLFGTTYQGGANSDGTVFEIAKTPTGYASTPPGLAYFSGADGKNPVGSLIADANGNLFGTTLKGGANGDGEVFELPNGPTGYPTKPTDLADFTDASGTNPYGDLIADANGDLFGTTSAGGANDDGTVFEIVNSAAGYASVPTVLASFNSANGAGPAGSLIADANGDLFGTTTYGGANGFGTVFEIADSAAGYASTPTDLADLTSASGEYPIGSLIADASGDLFGTASGGGANNVGTVFELTDSGYVVACYLRGTRLLTETGEVAVEDLAIGDRLVTLAGPARPIKWIGRRSYAGRFVKTHGATLLPILFRAGSLAENIPTRDLAVSPSHAMLLDGVLVPAERLVNGVSIAQVAHADQVEYFHIELETHDVIFAEGAASETFVDDDSRGTFHNAATFTELYPNAPPTTAEYCAPRVTEGYALAVIRRRIALRAERRAA